MWIKNTTGKKDAMLTFATFSFLIVTLNVLLSSIDTLTVGETTVIFKALDSTVMAVYLGSTFTAYVSRRWTESKYTKVESTGNPMVDMATSVVQQIISPDAAPTEEVSLPTEVALSQIEQAPLDDTQPIKKRKSKKETL